MKKEFSVTPWQVSEDIDYEKLLTKFGTSKIPDSVKKQLAKSHPLLRRGIYFSHRDFDLWLKDASSGKKVSILTGRGPSERMHLGHLVPFLVAKSLQELYDCEVYIPISEDEKFYVKHNLSFDEARKFADENILDILALGFKKGKTFFIKDFDYPEVYRNSAKIAKLITYSEAKAVFGLEPGNNLGWTFYPAVQAFHILLPQFVKGKHRTLVPVGIDQDPFIRLARDVAGHETLKFEKPSAVHSMFIPSLKGSAKMSSSDSESSNVIYLNDDEKTVKSKINKYAFSGGRDTLEEHRKFGGNPDVDISFQYLKMLFEHDDKKLGEIEKSYRSGKLLSGELKALAVEKINDFLHNHRKQRDKVKNHVDSFMLKI